MEKSNRQEKGCKEKSGNTMIKIVLVALLFAFLLNKVVLANAMVVGDSMAPALKKGDWVVASRLAYTNTQPQQGDVILFHKKDFTKEVLVKRIIGIPGDTVEIRDSDLIVNGTVLEEPYIKKMPVQNMEKRRIPENSYFVMGDNRQKSKDSRYWDKPYVSKDELIGKVICSYFPKIKKL